MSSIALRARTGIVSAHLRRRGSIAQRSLPPGIRAHAGWARRIRRPVGVGIDQVAVAEFERLPFGAHESFYRRFFALAEIAYCLMQANPAQHFAARFAAKEAAVKAYSGVARLAYWQIEVIRAADGAPSLRIWDVDWLAPATGLESYRPLVSLSHTDELATAIVVLRGEQT